MTDKAKKTLTISIDGQAIPARPGQTVFTAARAAGVYIPHLCAHPELKPYGGCRLCLVKVAGGRGLVPACTTVVQEGLKVESDTGEINAVRRTVAELIVGDHSVRCLQCAANRRCELQRVCAWLGLPEPGLPAAPPSDPVDDSNPFFSRDLSKCVLCGRCVRACAEIRRIHAIDFAHRGHRVRIVAGDGGPLADSNCVSCGTCLDLCPVGALTPKFEREPAAREVDTTCPYCGCGCGLRLGLRGDRIVSVRGVPGHPASRGQLCVKGRFGLDFVASPQRLTKPLIKEKGEFREASWDEALHLVAERLRTIREKHGADALAGLSSAKCTNEENFLFMKLMRAALGTNNVDHCARLCHASTVAGLARAFGSGAMTNSIDELERADCILVTGSNTTEAHPIIGLRIKEAVARGAKLIVADPRRIELAELATLHLRQRGGSDVMLFNAMMHEIIAAGLADEEFVAQRTENLAEAEAAIMPCTPEAAAAVTGVEAADIREAARLFAGAKRASIVYSMGITQHTTGTDNVLALANLAMLTGNVGRESTGVNPLRGQNNVQGACDLGALPNVYSGYQKVDDEAAREKFSRAWGGELPAKPGLTVVEMMHAAEKKGVRGLYVMGENPALSDPNSNRTRAALAGLDFLVVQDIFLTETARYADVVLPGASFAEKDGTFTNTERRVQRVRRAVSPPGEARPDWQIICDLANRLGHPFKYRGPDEVLDEIARLTPIYGGLSFARLEKEAPQWPCPAADHPGTRFLHQGRFSRGQGKFHCTPFREAAELPDREYPLLLSTGRLLAQFHTGTMTRRTAGLDVLGPPRVELNSGDARRLKIKDGDEVEVVSRRGRVTGRARVGERAGPGMVFIPFHFHEMPANMLTNDALDPVAKIPELKVCAVKVRRARPPKKKTAAKAKKK